MKNPANLTLLLLALLALACNLPLSVTATPGPSLPPVTPLTHLPVTVTPLPGPTPTVEPTPSPGAPTSAPESDEWVTVGEGLERRTAHMEALAAEAPTSVELVRIDPAYFVFRVHYEPTRDATISQWQARTGAAVIVNGGFFDPATRRTIALVVSDGERSGSSYVGQGGMLSVVGDDVDIRALVQYPYQAGEPLDQAVQGFPMLIYPGGRPVPFAASSDVARRTAIGKDDEGRIVIAVVDQPVVDLYSWRDWLSMTLGLDVALNLDGGSSTGLAMLAWGSTLLIETDGPIPAVITVYPRS